MPCQPSLACESVLMPLNTAKINKKKGDVDDIGNSIPGTFRDLCSTALCNLGLGTKIKKRRNKEHQEGLKKIHTLKRDTRPTFQHTCIHGVLCYSRVFGLLITIQKKQEKTYIQDAMLKQSMTQPAGGFRQAARSCQSDD